MAGYSGNGQKVWVVNADQITATLTAGDIEVGAVELKNGATDDRALIAASGSTPTFGVATLPVVANAAAPSLSEAKVAYLSSDLSGNQRVILKSETTKIIGVTPGAVADNAVSTENPRITGGVAQNATSYAPAYTAGDVAQLAVDKDSGGLLVSDRKKTRADDAISADPKQYSTISTATPATADATVFTLAAGEKGFIQNLSADAPLAYKLGASASTSSFNGVLNCGSVADDGKGGNVVIDDFIGAVSVAKISGTARYIAYKSS